MAETERRPPEPVPKPGTRNRFLNIVWLTHCIICVLYESLFVNNESKNIGLNLMRLSFHFSIHSFIRCIFSAANYFSTSLTVTHTALSIKIRRG